MIRCTNSGGQGNEPLIPKSKVTIQPSRLSNAKFDVKRGFWKSTRGGLHFCTNCGEFALQNKYIEFLSNYCPNCGAIMR